MLISVCVAAWNAGPWIGQMIESVQAQTWPDWELCIVDDGSTDGTAHVGQAKLHLAYLHTLMNLYRFGQKLVYPGPSELAARLWDEGEFDLVFIDADHSFEGVSADLRAWWPLVTPGGWLSGHDWGLYGVTDAAEAWLPEVGLSLKDVELADETCWFIRKVA